MDVTDRNRAVCMADIHLVGESMIFLDPWPGILANYEKTTKIDKSGENSCDRYATKQCTLMRKAECMAVLHLQRHTKLSVQPGRVLQKARKTIESNENRPTTKNADNQRKAIKNSCDRYVTATYINEES